MGSLIRTLLIWWVLLAPALACILLTMFAVATPRALTDAYPRWP